ncbi:MAG: polysaccharide biosynthesis tyrosine autokinase [Alphaproteobacteria bacterium]|nr:polysaccharide biosynthesis tyrosine autokinase [Alphaproteobacteria bacterium]
MQQKIALQPAQDDQAGRPIIDVTPEPVDEINMAQILDRVRRRWGVMTAIVISAIILTVVFLIAVTPTYTSRGQILVDNRANQVVNIKSVVSGPGFDINDVPNEVQILQSRILASEVIESLGLDEDPEFNLALRKEKLAKQSAWQKAWATIEGKVRGVFAALKTKEKKPESDKASNDSQAIADMDPQRAKINDVFLDNLDIASGKQTRVIDVEFTSVDPVKAATVVNELMRIYLANQVKYQKRGVQKATERLEKIVEELRDEVLMAENAVQAFRSESRLVDAKGTNVTAQQLSELNSRLVQARADEAAAAARLAQVSRLVKVPGSMAAAPDVLASPIILRLREKEIDLQRQSSELSSRYGSKHPKIIKVHAELKSLRIRIRQEINKIVESLSNEVAVARAKLAALKRGMVKLESAAIDINKAEIRLRELEREAESKRELHQTFVIRLRETSARQEMVEPIARVVSYAEPAQTPSFPKKTKTLAVATMLSALFAVAAALGLEALRRNFETSDEVERITGYRCLGILPRTNRMMTMLSSSEYLRLINPYSRLNQSIQNIRSTLYLANESRHPKTLLVTSALPREGKTTFALWYAGFCASAGQKVILIDSDLDRPKVHNLMHVANDIGLTNVLADDLELNAVIRTDSKTGIDFITAGERRSEVGKLIDSVKMRDILESLSWDYDLIVIDSAPVLAMTDAHIIAKLVDTTVFALQWRRTKRDIAISAARRLESVDVTSIAGFVLTQVSPSKSAGVIGYTPYTRESDSIGHRLLSWMGGSRARREHAAIQPRLES